MADKSYEQIKRQKKIIQKIESRLIYEKAKEEDALLKKEKEARL